MGDKEKLILVGVGVGLAVLVTLIFVGTKAAAAAAKVANAINPLNHDNVFATGANAVGVAVTGNKDFTVGGTIYDLTHPTFDPNAKPVPPEKVVPIEDPNTGFNF